MDRTYAYEAFNVSSTLTISTLCGNSSVIEYHLAMVEAVGLNPTYRTNKKSKICTIKKLKYAQLRNAAPS